MALIGVEDAAQFVALGLHALQHRGQEAGGIVTYHPDIGFSSERRFGYVRDNFTSAEVMKKLPGTLAIGHVRYSTAGSKGATAIRDVQPFFGEFAVGGCAIAHNGNLTNATALRKQLIERGAIFQSSSDTECIIHLMARSMQKTLAERIKGRSARRGRRVQHRRHDPHETDRRARRAGGTALVLGRVGARRAGCWPRKPARWTSSARISCARSSRARWW